MDEVLLRSDVTARGLTDNDLARLLGLGDLERVRRGAYARVPEAGRTPEERHLLLIAATEPQLGDGAVMGHASAGVLHGLPLWPDQLGAVTRRDPAPVVEADARWSVATRARWTPTRS